MSLRTAFTLIPVESTDMSSVRVLEFRRSWTPYPTHRPRIRFLFVRSALCYQLPSDPLLPRRPCRVATSYPTSG